MNAPIPVPAPPARLWSFRVVYLAIVSFVLLAVISVVAAESLIERKEFDPIDQLERYVQWWRHGHLSSTNECFDIGNTVADALARFERSRQPYSGSADPWSAGNGSIMRLAPVPLFYARQPAEAIEKSGQSSQATHRAIAAIDACRYFGGLLAGATNGVGKEELLAVRYSPVPGHWDQHPLVDEIDEIAAGSFKRKSPPEIKGTGYVVKSLEAALWAFHHGDSFREGALLAVNLGDDADTTGAVYGQVGIPEPWHLRLAKRSLITGYADRLFEQFHTVFLSCS